MNEAGKKAIKKFKAFVSSLQDQNKTSKNKDTLNLINTTRKKIANIYYKLITDNLIE